MRCSPPRHGRTCSGHPRLCRERARRFAAPPQCPRPLPTSFYPWTFWALIASKAPTLTFFPSIYPRVPFYLDEFFALACLSHCRIFPMFHHRYQYKRKFGTSAIFCAPRYMPGLRQIFCGRRRYRNAFTDIASVCLARERQTLVTLANFSRSFKPDRAGASGLCARVIVARNASECRVFSHRLRRSVARLTTIPAKRFRRHLAQKGRLPEASRQVGRVRFPRADLQSAPGRLRVKNARPARRPACGLHRPLYWDGRERVTPVPT